MDIFNKFSKSTGLKVNLEKCKIYCEGMDKDTKDNIAKDIDFKEGQMPFIKLGVPMTGKKLSIQ